MSTILLSFEPEWFSLLESGKKKFEYRKHFPDGDKTTVYFYVSNPVKAITGVAVFGNKEELCLWKEKYSDRPIEVKERISEFMEECNFAIPMLSFTRTIKISLKQLRTDIEGFIVPRMYYYIDDSDLLNYLKTNLTPLEETHQNDFSFISDDDIC